MAHPWFKNPKAIIFTPLLLALAFAVACGASATATPVPKPAAPAATLAPIATTAPTPTAVPKATATATPAPATPPKAKVDRLKVAVALEREVNDPTLATIVFSAQWVPVYEALVEENPRNEYVPMLATDWSVSPDAKTWTFNLRKGIPFHSGWGEFTAKDLVHTMKRHVREDSLSSDRPATKLLLDNLEVVNDYQVIFRPPRPMTDTYWLQSTQRWNLILSKAYFDATGQERQDLETMVGTGPYQFKERRLGQYILYERVPYKHWRVTPDFKELQMFAVPESATRLAMLITGEAHLTLLPFDTQAQATARGMKVIKATTPLNVVYAMFGGNYLPTKPHYDPNIPWTKRQVREALNRAVNRKEIQNTIMGGRGEPMVVTFWHPALPGWNPQWLERFDKKYGYDPKRAKELLVEAGYPNGFKATYILTPRPELPELKEIGEAIASYWRAIGVDVKLEEREFSTWRERFIKEKIQGEAWTDATPTRELDTEMLRVLYYSKGPTHFFETEFLDSKYDELLTTTDAKKRDQILKEAGDYLFEEYATLPLFWYNTEFVVNPEVVGEYKTSGIRPPKHLEYIKAAR